ncbi:MAG: hypothetical protein ACREJC_05230 [Tepidisphaeraceae bacterium]
MGELNGRRTDFADALWGGSAPVEGCRNDPSHQRTFNQLRLDMSMSTEKDNSFGFTHP